MRSHLILFLNSIKMMITITVKTGSRQGPRLERLTDDSYMAFLRERPHDGAANAALIKLLSDYFSIPKTSIKIKKGITSRTKLIEF